LVDGQTAHDGRPWHETNGSEESKVATMATQGAGQMLVFLTPSTWHRHVAPSQGGGERIPHLRGAGIGTRPKARPKGQQVVRVERVVVHEGGEAIVGNIQPAAARNVGAG